MQERAKTRTRTFRFNVDLLKRLGKASRRVGISENEFVVALLKNRLLIDPFIPAFDGIWLDTGEMKSILGTANVNALETGASEMAQKNFPLIVSLYEANGIDLDLRRFVVDILGGYGHWFRLEGEEVQRWMTLSHPYGPKWSAYVKAYIQSAYSTISKRKIEVDITDQLIRIEFPPS
jgi:hypothetical protein